MASLNKVQLIGRLGKDPEIRTVGSGDKVANFSMAMTEKWTDKRSGEKKEKTEWANVTVWGDGLVGVVERYVKKGDLLYVEGKFSTRKWEKDGKTNYATEVVIQGMGGALTMLGSKGDSSGGGGGSNGGGSRGDAGRRSTGGGSGANSSSGGDAAGSWDSLDDSIPF